MNINFPRVTSQEELDYKNLKQLFPWGCSELRDNLQEPVLVDINPFWYRYQFPRCRENIYKAIKYGVWTFPDPQAYIDQYNVYRRLKSSQYTRNMYYALCSRQNGIKYAYGVAEVVGFEPRQSFLYWTPESKVGRPEGIIRLKFIAVGKVALTNFIDYQNPDDFRKYCKLLRESRMDFMEMQHCDFEQDKLRSNYKKLKDEHQQLSEFAKWVNNNLQDLPRGGGKKSLS